jgi:cob(I)alamin adenosyltransferase
MSNLRRIIVLTGNGKGKTTSALGCAIRAKGKGFDVKIYQFLKSDPHEYGEHIFLKDKIEILKLGHKGRSNFNYDENDINAARLGFEKILKTENEKSLIILDEISYVVNKNWIEKNKVLNFLKEKDKVSFILTGRNMPQEIIELADTVSEVKEIKHILSKGVTAMDGFEF